MLESSANKKMCKELVADGDRLVSEENGGSLSKGKIRHVD